MPDNTATRSNPTALEPGLARRVPTEAGSPETPPAFWGGPDAYWHLVHTLRLTLPPPEQAVGSDDPAALARRDRAAIARIAALVPANAAEAEVAAQFVAASEQWKDCLRLAQLPETKPEWAAKCRAQAAAMMRQADSALRMLQRLQQARARRDANAAGADRAAWTEHCALSLMAEALATPPRIAEPAAPPTPPPAPATPAPATPDPSEPDLIAAAERYAARYPERAATIRRTGRLPHDVRYFDPPEAALARLLITGRTPALIALDGVRTV